jgi:hypothetical protein
MLSCSRKTAVQGFVIRRIRKTVYHCDPGLGERVSESLSIEHCGFALVVGGSRFCFSQLSTEVVREETAESAHATFALNTATDCFSPFQNMALQCVRCLPKIAKRINGWWKEVVDAQNGGTTLSRHTS